MSVTIRKLGSFLFGQKSPPPTPAPETVQRIVLPPEPMFRDPEGGEWRPL